MYKITPLSYTRTANCAKNTRSTTFLTVYKGAFMKTRLFCRITSQVILLASSVWTQSLKAELIHDDIQLNMTVEYPNVIVEPLEAMTLLKVEAPGVKTVNENFSSLEKSIAKYAQKTFVPYIWGGNRVGSISECDACVTCLQKRSVEKFLVGGEPRMSREEISKGHSSCASCDRCGIDCSNLAHRVFNEAELEFPYLTSKSMAGDAQHVLDDKYNLVEIGHNLRLARVGDLIVQESHVVIFLGFVSDDSVSYLHSSRRGEDERPFGGINVVKSRSLESFQKTVVRILRHRQLIEPQVYSEGIVTNESAKSFVN